MLVVRSPMRISFAGGGTDLPAYYEQHGGCVVSTTLNKYVYVIATLNGHDLAEVSSSDYRAFFSHRPGQRLLWEGELALPKAMLHQFGVERGVHIFVASEVPPGTGLGSSSAVAVGLAKTLATLCGLTLSRAELAEVACYVEIDKLGFPIGKQDQYAAAFGGFNSFGFHRDRVAVEPLPIGAEVRRRLEDSLMLFFTGTARNSAAILGEQSQASRQEGSRTVESLHALKEAAREVRERLEDGDLDSFARLLHRSWERKKQLAQGISNPRIDESYQLALEAGALGGKITGAGGGGFLMLYCEPDRQAAVREALEPRGLHQMGFHFDQAGATVLVNTLSRGPGFGRPDLSFLRGEQAYVAVS